MAPASNSSSSYYLIKSCSFGLWRYIFLAMGSVPGLTGISCTSPSPLSGGAVLGKSEGNTPLNSFWGKSQLCLDYILEPFDIYHDLLGKYL